MRRQKVVDVRKTKSILLCLVIRRGTVHAAREGRDLHGGHCLVRTQSYDWIKFTSLHFQLNNRITLQCHIINVFSV